MCHDWRHYAKESLTVYGQSCQIETSRHSWVHVITSKTRFSLSLHGAQIHLRLESSPQNTKEMLLWFPTKAVFLSYWTFVTTFRGVPQCCLFSLYAKLDNDLQFYQPSGVLMLRVPVLRWKGWMKNSRRSRLITLWCLEMETPSRFKTKWEQRLSESPIVRLFHRVLHFWILSVALPLLVPVGSKRQSSASRLRPIFSHISLLCMHHFGFVEHLLCLFCLHNAGCWMLVVQLT